MSWCTVSLKSNITKIKSHAIFTDSDVQKIRTLCEKLRVTGILLDTIDKEMFTVVDHLNSKEEVLDVMIQNTCELPKAKALGLLASLTKSCRCRSNRQV